MEEAGKKQVVETVTAHAGANLVIANEIDSLHIHSSPRPPPPLVVHLPQRPPLVIGRQAEIEVLRDRLKKAGSVTFVSGLAGSGKTTLALEYAHRYQRDFESVHWLSCRGRTLVQIAGDLAWQLGLKLDSEPDDILRQLQDQCSRKRCLLVLDNVEDDTAAQLLLGGRSSVLITTRLHHLKFLRLQPLHLPSFTEEQCFELFDIIVGKGEVQKHETEARSLFRRLGHLPIGIAVAASLIRDDVRYTIDALEKKLPADTFALLKEALAALSPAAQTLLGSMTVCAPEGFRLDLAAEVADLDETSSLDALQEIYSRSLVDEVDRASRRYRLHTLVREAAGVSDVQRRIHAECVLKEFQDWENGWRRCEEDMADWRAAFSWLLGQPEDEKAWSMVNKVACGGYALTQRLGRLPEAHEIGERMAQEADRRKDLDRLQLWYGNQALILEAWGRLEEAMALYRKEEAICLELDDQNGFQRCYGNVAVILDAWGRLEEAMALLKKQEAICLELGDQNGLQHSYGNQALVLLPGGRLQEAMVLLKKQEAICLELGDQDGLQHSYGNQALILKGWGRLEEAMALHKKKEAICLELGNQESLQISYGNQALILKGWGRLEEALALLKKKEAICLELGNRRSLRRSYGDQAATLKTWGRLEEAQALYKKEEAICLELDNQDGLQACYGHQAMILQVWGRLEEAMALHKKEEAICLELDDQDGLQRCYGHQDLILQAWGRLEEAMALLKKQEAICLELGNQDELQGCYGRQSMILRASGPLEEAVALLKKQETICLELGNHYDLARCYGDWGLLAQQQGDTKTSREKLDRALTLFTELKMPAEIRAVQDLLDETNGDNLRNYN